MSIQNSLKFYLENTFHGKFDIKKVIDSNEKYSITLFGSQKQYFEILVNIHNDIRLTITCTPEKYGVAFLNEMNNSSIDKRKEFIKYWKIIGDNKFEVNINNVKMDFDSFLNNTSKWNSFCIKYNEIPYYSENEDKEFKICNITSLICGMVLSLVSFVIEGYEEGKKIEKTISVYERNSLNREICLFLKGYKCSVCGFDFEEKYGKIGHNFIEVHHQIPISEMEEGHIVIPENELFPVCSNCHSMIHTKNPPYTIEEMKKIIGENHDNN